MKELVSDLTVHAKAACHIVGIPTKLDIKDRPRSGEETAPMVTAFEEVLNIQELVHVLDKTLYSALSELLPDFYASKVDPTRAQP